MISNEGRYLCQWAPATGFLLVTFGTVGALTSFEFSESGQPPLNTRWAENPKLETQELPPWYRLILFESFLGILLLDPAFSSNILLNKFVQVFDTLKIPVHCFGTWDTLKIVICPIISQALFLLLCNFHMNLNMQNSWPNQLSTYCRQFSTGNHLHVKWSTNPRVTSILPAAIFSLCALPGQFQLCYYFSKFPFRFCVCYLGRADHFIQFVF